MVALHVINHSVNGLCGVGGAAAFVSACSGGVRLAGWPDWGGKGVRWERPTKQNLGKVFDRPRVHTIQTILLVVEILGHTFRVPLLARHSHVGDLSTRYDPLYPKKLRGRSH